MSGEVVFIEKCFIAIGVVVRSFVQHMRPIIIIDGAHLKGTFKGTMFLAVGMDANNQILPIAYGIGKTESGEEWIWFMSKLKECIGENPSLLIISDRAASIDLAIRTVFPLAYHCVCCRHLLMSLGLNGKAQNDMWWATCKAYTVNDFKHHLNILVKHRPDVLQTLNHIPPEKWTRAFAQCNRYNYMTSNSAESVNALSVQARKLPITKVLDFFTDVTQRWYFERRQAAEKNKNFLTPWAESKIFRRIRKCRSWTVAGINGSAFNVDDGKRRCVVDMQNRSCECRIWQLSGLPCCHAISASTFLKESDCSQWAVHWFRSEVHRATYAESVYSVPDPLNWEIPEDFSKIATPHMNKRQAGRPPENKRIPSKGEDSRPRECSRCHAIGHTRDRCRRPLSSEVGSSSRSIKQTNFVNSENFRQYIIENTMSTTQNSQKFEYNLKDF
ncbi:hypothetical protein QVD17_32185 [Tagetes erecta]|uniref:SWIM-type domain-containing protein n=1 Tax=Tagetes erecta TaxID=13708 RepID=A0AAD8K4S6_TARER|nr:hypothetical protein QVD17_32185 [Tagetes erecta]